MPLEFESQKENPYNKLLPYQERLDEEAVSLLAEIKYNLGRAVLFHELTPGILIWCNRLATYLRVYGRKFSVDDHLLFINLLSELVTIPDLEPQFVKGFAYGLVQLLKKKELLSRKVLTLPWRPLYNLVESIKFSKFDQLGLQKFPKKFVEGIIQLVKVARIYFPAEATREMLEEWRPLLCPFDTVMSKGIYYLTYFLPTCLLPEERDQGFKLWFDELMDYWLNCTQHVPESQEDLMKLFARLAEDNAGYIDWNPYMSKIFNRFFSGLHLPIGKSRPTFGGQFELLAVGTGAKWMVYMMGGKNQVLDHLSTLFKALESFYHPSNYGSHSQRLLRFVCQLTENLVKRLHRERFQKPSWVPEVPDHAKLTDEETKRFVEILKPAIMLAVFSKTGSYDAATALQNLSLIRPDIVLPPLLDRTFEALQAVLEPHQVVATLSCITAVARSLVASGEHFPEAPTHVLPLLQLALPGIDPNDFRKSMATFTLISSVVSLIPIVDCSEALQDNIEMTKLERDLCSASARFEDFVFQFLDRCFALVDNSVVLQTTQQDNLLVENMDTQEGLMGMGLASTLHTVLMQSSEKIFKSALKRLFNFCESRVLEVTVAGKMVSDMCRAAVKSNPGLTLKKFVPFCCAVIERTTSVEGIKDEENVDEELLWNLEILSELVRCAGHELLPYKDLLEKVIESTIHLKCKKAYTRGSKILKGMLTYLTQIYSTEWRSIPDRLDKPPSEHLYIRDWGKPGNIKNLGINWHVPSKEELKFAEHLLTKHLRHEMNQLEECIKGKAFTREELNQCLHVIVICIYSASPLLRNWTDEPRVKNLGPDSMVTRERRFHSATSVENENTYSEITRKEIALLLHKFLGYMLTEREDDTKTFQMIAKVPELKGSLRCYDEKKLHRLLRWRSTAAVKRALEDKSFLIGKKEKKGKKEALPHNL